MQPNIRLRNAAPTDLPVIVSIYNSTVPGRQVTADTEPVTVESRMNWYNEHTPDHRPLWVVEDEEEVIGWLSFQSFYGRPAYQGTAEISIYLHEKARGKKLGSFLLQSAIEACPRLRIKTLLGFIFGHNEPSLRIFSQFGFQQWALLPRVAELDNIERDLVIVGKRVVE
jgi:L-amino acid N-acyltransferase YncA